MNIDELVIRAKDGDITSAELKEVAAIIKRDEGGDLTYRLLYVLLRSRSVEHEDIIAGFVQYERDPQVASLVLHTLVSQWRLGARYRNALLGAMSGFSWDEDNDVKIGAVTAAGEYLRESHDPEVLASIIKIARTNDPMDPIGQAAVEGLSRALGDDHLASLAPKDSNERAMWIDRILERAVFRLTTESGQC